MQYRCWQGVHLVCDAVACYAIFCQSEIFAAEATEVGRLSFVECCRTEKCLGPLVIVIRISFAIGRVCVCARVAEIVVRALQEVIWCYLEVFKHVCASEGCL